ncbi:ATP-binding domain-containing protein [Nostoc linckia FACHB-104]|nr:ATP-binding domain-containing protein [Nostoc linckia FACHB-104]
MVSATQLKFVTTEPLSFPGQHAEEKVWNAVRAALSARDQCFCFWTYPIFIQDKQLCYEPDVLILDQALGLIVIEVKNIFIDQITHIEGHNWHTQGFWKSPLNAYNQAKNQLHQLINHCNKYALLNRKVSGRVIVALPSITATQWEQRGFHQQACCPPILFKEDLAAPNLLHLITTRAGYVQQGQPLTDEAWQQLQLLVCGPLPPPPVAGVPDEPPPATRRWVIDQLQQWVGCTDLEQLHIGMEIPPGPQRIRGIAGSGKTVLLCKKAAWMHWYHPEWDIALVFFTRSLYDQAVRLVGEWVQFFSGGDRQYDPCTSRLKILHAWGDAEQPGLYSTICHLQGISPTLDEPVRGTPPEKLAYLSKRLLTQYDIQPLFDAVLIDEGQDLALDAPTLKVEDKQSIYWLAWQALKPVSPTTPEVRRLIWAYDEAQSLDSLTVPSSKEVLGEALSHVLGGNGGAWYAGGIRKAHAMRHCYRTPGEILTIAHAMGMGWLRPEGMLTGITNKKDWAYIGYEVDGDFRKVGEPITLRRPAQYSPHPIRRFWEKDLITFTTYDSYDEELQALGQHIAYTIHVEGLKPSRDILVIVLGDQEESLHLQRRAAFTLQQQGINFYIPSAPTINQFLDQRTVHEKRPNDFWKDDAVTISRIYRAKGNEAYMVYLIGFQHIAQQESTLRLRNQLFVALTRSKAWVQVSGVSDYPMYEELRKVMESPHQFTFTYKKPLGRVIGEEIFLQ